MQQKETVWFKFLLIIIALLVIAVVIYCFIGMSNRNPDFEKQIKTLTEENNKLKQQSKDYEENITNLKKEHADYVAKLEEKIEEYQYEITDLQRQQKVHLSELRKQRDELKKYTGNDYYEEIDPLEVDEKNRVIENEDYDEENTEIEFKEFPTYTFKKSENPNQGSVSCGWGRGYWHYRSKNDGQDYILYSEDKFYILKGNQWYILEGGIDILDSDRLHYLGKTLEESYQKVQEKYSDYNIPKEIPNILKTEEWLNTH